MLKALCTWLVLAGFSMLACAAENPPAQLPPYTYADQGTYTVYVEQMPGKDWDEKIRNAVNRAATGRGGTTIQLPPGEIRISKTIKLWRQIRTRDIDTRCDGVEMSDIRQVWASIKGGHKTHIPRGITLCGTGGGVTILKWSGGANQVMLDMPAPWHVTIRGITFDGDNAEGLIGLRYRAGWEFGVNGGKRNLFEDLSFYRMDVAVDIGGPFCPDLVASSFRRFGVQACRIGFRLVGGNVAEQWFENGTTGGCEEAAFKLIGFRGRVVRNLAEKNTPTQERVLKDADGREIFLEQIPQRCFKRHVRRKQHDDVPGSGQRPWVGGGAPTSFISKVVAHNSFANAWFIDSNWAAVRVEHLRCEGAAGFLRVGGRGMSNVRFDDYLMDVNATTTGNTSGYAIIYEKAGPLVFVGGVFEGPIGLGNNTTVHVIATRFNHSQRIMNAFIHENQSLPEGSFFTRTDKARLIPHRRQPGITVTSGVHESIGFVQLPGTSGARVLRSDGTPVNLSAQ